jgi:hypothetical protein
MAWLKTKEGGPRGAEYTKPPQDSTRGRFVQRSLSPRRQLQAAPGPQSRKRAAICKSGDERKVAKFLLSPKSLRDRVDRSNQTSRRGLSAAEAVQIHLMARELDGPDLSLISHSSRAQPPRAKPSFGRTRLITFRQLLTPARCL